MEIISKSLFTYIDLAMDHFKTTIEIREKYLVWLSNYFDLTDGEKKKWSIVGKGIDYHTFKNWISKDNRFTHTKNNWLEEDIKLVSHYHDVNSVIEKINLNSYESKLNLYHALCLLTLVDKKYILERIKFLNWTAKIMKLDNIDCSVIREDVVEEFDLSFDIKNISQIEKEEIFLCGLKMAHLSGELIDSLELDFLSTLESKLSLSMARDEMKYYCHYLEGIFSKNQYFSSIALHKIGAVLLTIIGSDELIDKREGEWFKSQLSGLDNSILSSFLKSDISALIEGMNDEEKMLCYLFGIEVSLRDEVIHENEKFWLDRIYSSIDTDFKLDRELSFVFYELLNRNFSFISKEWSYFKRVTKHLNSSASSFCMRWGYLNKVAARKCEVNSISKLLFGEGSILTMYEIRDELVVLSHGLLVGNLPCGDLLSGFFREISSNFSTDVQEGHADMLICEILKISFLDNQLELIEDDFVREVQYRFKINDAQVHKVLFMAAFLMGKDMRLSARLNYSQL